ncbi:MAG: DUF805 domain-containing protein [Rhizobiaceae bacterium]
MSFINAIVSGFARAFNFSGRANRRDFWFFLGFAVIAWLALLQFDLQYMADYLGFLPGEDGVPRYFSTGWLVICALPLVSLVVRRVHDHDKPGWMALTVLPLVWWLVGKGTKGPNRYG